MSDLLLVLGIVSLVVGCFLISLIVGLIVLGLALVLFSLALSDGKGLPWRS